MSDSTVRRLRSQIDPHIGLYDDPGDYCWICEKHHSEGRLQGEHGCPDLLDAQRAIAKAYKRLFPKRIRKERQDVEEP